jgi:endonuclease/exonuclease/phosphatase family metal-dependent hydrolase
MTTSTARQLTFGSYNLQNGGLDERGRDGRLIQQLEMLASAGADVWALQECKGWAADGNRYLHFAEQLLGMRGFMARSSHHGCDLAVLIRQSSGIRVISARHEERPPYWHAVARVDVLIDGMVYSLVSAHLAPSSPAVRLTEAEAFALIAKEGTVIAGGDWNAVPASDPAPPGAGALAGTALRKLDPAPARAIEEAGLTDVAAHMGRLDPTVGHASGLRYRCDRLYTRLPPESIISYQVITEDKPKSDHRPVIATFRLAAGGGPT